MKLCAEFNLIKMQPQTLSSKLRSNIMDLVCRTCLKINKDRYNMFTYSFNNKLISDLIMELTSIKVAPEDKFPVNICNTCMIKLNSAYNFKTMVTLSNIKLINFYKTKTSSMINVEKSQDDWMIIKEETPSYGINEDNLLLKCEQNITDLLNIDCNINNNELHVADPLDLKSDHFKDDHLQVLDELAKSNSVINISKIKEERLKMPEEQVRVDKDVKFEENPPTAIIVNEKPKRKNTRLNSPRNVNEQQVELLDNADYKRIMSMGLSKKEKQNLPVYCPDCNKTFTFRYFVGIHAHLHTGNLPFKCDKCDMRFPKRPILKQHLKVHIETKDFPCEICGKAFTTLNSLRIHKTMHMTERPHKCDICGKGFKLNFLLQKHIRIHSKEKNHICEICGKAFVDLSGLTNHRIIHTGSRQTYPCKLCNKSFSRKRALQVHLKRHTGERTHVCDQCGKSFHYSVLLQQHLLIHTGEKPYSCELCGKKFRQKACIPRHMRIHTGETPYPCKICPSRFKYSHHLLNHMKSHNKEVIEESDLRKDEVSERL